jgi:adenylylsulfate kinase-like enzyme
MVNGVLRATGLAVHALDALMKACLLAELGFTEEERQQMIKRTRMYRYTAQEAKLLQEW